MELDLYNSRDAINWFNKFNGTYKMKKTLPQFSRKQYEAAKKKLNKVNQQYIDEVNSIVGSLVEKQVPFRIFDVTSSITATYSLDNILDCSLSDYSILENE